MDIKGVNTSNLNQQIKPQTQPKEEVKVDSTAKTLEADVVAISPEAQAMKHNDVHPARPKP